ncbi:putative AC transposase [Sesamum angolense]|uniref:AC transposase n=1 Tax=Sesamum angolense TaxID=2727404 RepID=A0AAE2BS20_9LAMI|nr:putative AC transposase [Sesamum angolense]
MDQSEGNKRKQSVVWEHFTKVRGVNDVVHAKYNYCEKFLSGNAAYGTTHLKKHLNNACPKFKLECRSGLGVSSRSEFKFDQVKIRKDLEIAYIKHKYPFNISDHEYFEIFFNGLNPNFKLPYRNTIRGDVIQVYEEEKVKVYKLLDVLRCKVSLTMDIWTSDHSHVAYCCLIAPFVDNGWELQKKILASREIQYPHDGEALFNFMKEIILKWNLEKKLFSIVVDNAANNNVMIRKLKDWLICDSLIDFDGDLLHRIDKQYKFNPLESEWEVAKIVHECLQIFYDATRHFSGRKIYGDNANSYIKRVRNTFYKLFISYGGSLTPSMDESASMSSFGVETRESLRDFDRWYYESRVSINQKSELESYLDVPRFSRAEAFNILDWWKTNSPKLPILAKIVRDILAVSTTTVASEASFSAEGESMMSHGRA